MRIDKKIAMITVITEGNKKNIVFIRKTLLTISKTDRQKRIIDIPRKI